MQIRKNWITLGAYFYLLIPFLIFCLGFLKPIISIPALILLCFVIRRVIKHPRAGDITFNKSELAIAILVILCWVWLSGIGGYAFQNWDFHWRNAVFRDLINFQWPVYYPSVASLQPGTQMQPVYSLVYYFGYWLPSALLGKIAGWQAAQFGLFAWTCLGIFLATVLIKTYVKTNLVFVVCFLIFFSGMDAAGTITLRALTPGLYPSLWPPIQHLEWWAGAFQFSSFTTQLFWVFNQTVPVWICMAIHLANPNPRRGLFLFSLCFFFAPLPALGFAPFVLMEFPRKTFDPENLSLQIGTFEYKPFLKKIAEDFKPILSFENLFGGAVILIISSAFYSVNRTTGSLRLYNFAPFSILALLLFIPYEWFILWVIFAKKYYRNLYWYFVGIILFVCPFLVIGKGTDLVMRVSITALFLLMVWSIQAIINPKKIFRPLLIAVLLLGSITSIYEINRSIYRTASYYFDSANQQIRYAGSVNLEELNIPKFPEKDHPGFLQADAFASFSNTPISTASNFIADVGQSQIFNFMFRSPSIHQDSAEKKLQN